MLYDIRSTYDMQMYMYAVSQKQFRTF